MRDRIGWNCFPWSEGDLIEIYKVISAIDQIEGHSCIPQGWS